MIFVKFIAIHILFSLAESDVVLSSAVLSYALNGTDIFPSSNLLSRNTFSSLLPNRNDTFFNGNDTVRSHGRGTSSNKRPGLPELPGLQEIVPTTTRQINPAYHTAGPGPAFDKDMRTTAEVVLSKRDGSGHGDELWWQAEFGGVVYIATFTIHSYYYTSWFNKTWGCAQNKETYKFCKDEMSYVDVDMYLGSRFVKRCGTLVQGHGLRQQDQVYRFTCDGYGDRISLSKKHSTTMLLLHEIVITGIQSPEETSLTLSDAVLDQPKRTGRKYSDAKDCLSGNSTYAQLAASHNWLTVTLEKQSKITKIELYAPDDESELTTIKDAVIYVGKSYCGIADGKDQLSRRYLIHCPTNDGLLGDAVKIQSSSKNMKVARVVVFGIEEEVAPTIPNIEEKEFITTQAPVQTKTPFRVPDIVPDTEERADGVEIAVVKIEEPIPIKVLQDIGNLPNATKTPLGFLAFAGYVDNTMDENAEEKPSRDRERTKERAKFDQNDLEKATQSFLRFNGHVEDGDITEEMVRFMQKDRCGNADLVFDENGEKCTNQTSTLIIPAKQKTLVAFMMPGAKESASLVAESESYYLEVDIKFNDVRNGRSRSVFLGFNYDTKTANGEDTPLEIVALRLMSGKLCAQFLTLFDGQFLSNLVSKESVLDSCYSLTENDLKTLAFKARLDVYKRLGGILGKVHVSISGKEMANTVYKTQLISSAVVITHEGDHDIMLSRLCKRWTLSSGATKRIRTKRIKPTRTKRFSLSNHKWGIVELESTIKFNFQNYSSILEQDGTRQGILRALNLFSKTGFNFQEVVPTATAEIVFMFNKGHHADQKTFHGAGVEKAHAFAPTHSEIHFNDFEKFAISEKDGTTSMFYVAAHEIGHALGIRHSQQQDALMQPGYPTNAFQFQNMHNDDIMAVRTLYPEIPQSGFGSVNMLERPVVGKTQYTPKTSFPTDCHSQIDAAVGVGDFAYIISGPFIWRMRQASDGWHSFDGYPKRVTDVFRQAHGTIEALFVVPHKSKTTLFALYAGNLIARYTVILKEGNAEPFVLLTWAGKERKDFLKKKLKRKETTVDQLIKGAFAYGPDKTILVADDQLSYFELLWKFNNAGSPTLKSITQKTDMISLIGRGLNKVAFNAAMKLNKRDKEEIYMFGARYVWQEEPFTTREGDNQRWHEVPNWFKIAGWCRR